MSTRDVRAQEKIAKGLQSEMSKLRPDENLTKWTKIMAWAIIIQTITLIVINLLR